MHFSLSTSFLEVFNLYVTGTHVCFVESLTAVCVYVC